MINPNKIHRARATISKITKYSWGNYYEVTKDGRTIIGYDLPAKFSLGELVNIQTSYSIMAESYVIRTINKIRTKKELLCVK